MDGRRLQVFAGTWSILATVFLTSCAGKNERGSTPLPPTPEFESDFLQNRIAHQQAAIEMAQACVQKAQRDALKQFCSALIDTEARESKQLQAWLNQWYAVSAAPGARERTTEGYRNFMAAMRTPTGAEFESRFLSGMRLHHHEGVRESQACQTGAVHEELRSLCATMVDEQEREIKADERMDMRMVQGLRRALTSGPWRAQKPKGIGNNDERNTHICGDCGP